MDYLDRVNQTRQTTAQTNKEQSELASMLAEMKKMQMASLMGSQGKSTVILTDQTDLGDKLKEMVSDFSDTVKSIDVTKLTDDQLNKLIDIKGTLDDINSTLTDNQNEVVRSNKAVVSAINALELKPEINLPEPKVSVTTQKVDLSSLERTMREVFQRQEPVDQDGDGIPDRFDLSRYIAQDMKDGEETQYVGFVNPEGHWYIVENDVKGNKMRYVFGTSGYSKHFKQASSYKYQILDKAINATS